MRTRTAKWCLALALAAAGPAVGSDDDALLAHWSMDAMEAGRLEDSSGHGHTAVLRNPDGARPELVAGQLGNAIRFPRKHTMAFEVSGSDDLAAPSTLTVMAWIRPAQRRGTFMIACRKGDPKKGGTSPGWRLEHFWARGRFRMGTVAGNEFKISSAQWSVAPRFWSHVAATCDGQTVRLFVNAVEVETREVTGPIAPERRPLVLANYIGRKDAYFFQGDLDDVRIYARALTDEQILAAALGKK
jgi:hypothetical protein